MKIKVLIFISIASISGCSSFHYSAKDITGTYTQIRDDSSKSFINLVINDTGFSLVDAADYTKRHHDAGKYICCDTITYGTWKIDNKYGVLSLSTPQLSGTFVKDFVHEEVIRNNDSVYFFISNPIEKNMGKMHKYIFYNFELYSIGDFGNDLAENYYYTNRIAVANPKHERIQSFSINVYTTPEYAARNIVINPVKTVPYEVKQVNANSFTIDIPELTFKYISYLRLKEHLIKIINKNELTWDGVRYSRN